MERLICSQPCREARMASPLRSPSHPLLHPFPSTFLRLRTRTRFPPNPPRKRPPPKKPRKSLPKLPRFRCRLRPIPMLPRTRTHRLFHCRPSFLNCPRLPRLRQNQPQKLRQDRPETCGYRSLRGLMLLNRLDPADYVRELVANLPGGRRRRGGRRVRCVRAIPDGCLLRGCGRVRARRCGRRFPRC